VQQRDIEPFGIGLRHIADHMTGEDLGIWRSLHKNTRSEPTKQNEDKHDHEQEADTSAWSPAVGMPAVPGECPEQQQEQDDKQNHAHGRGSIRRARRRSAALFMPNQSTPAMMGSWLPLRYAWKAWAMHSS
jgi:hypothetical protein